MTQLHALVKGGNDYLILLLLLAVRLIISVAVSHDPGHVPEELHPDVANGLADDEAIVVGSLAVVLVLQ